MGSCVCHLSLCIQGKSGRLEQRGHSGTAQVLDATGTPVELCRLGLDSATGAEPQYSLQPVALVAQAFWPSVCDRDLALAQFQIADHPAQPFGYLAGTIVRTRPGCRPLQTGALSIRCPCG
ncbi:hypothetical protein D3C79_747330 [compost metagenome]